MYSGGDQDNMSNSLQWPPGSAAGSCWLLSCSLGSSGRAGLKPWAPPGSAAEALAGLFESLIEASSSTGICCFYSYALLNTIQNRIGIRQKNGSETKCVTVFVPVKFLCFSSHTRAHHHVLYQCSLLSPVTISSFFSPFPKVTWLYP